MGLNRSRHLGHGIEGKLYLRPGPVISLQEKCVMEVAVGLGETLVLVRSDESLKTEVEVDEEQKRRDLAEYHRRREESASAPAAAAAITQPSVNSAVERCRAGGLIGVPRLEDLFGPGEDKASKSIIPPTSPVNELSIDTMSWL